MAARLTTVALVEHGRTDRDRRSVEDQRLDDRGKRGGRMRVELHRVTVARDATGRLGGGIYSGADGGSVAATGVIVAANTSPASVTRADIPSDCAGPVDGDGTNLESAGDCGFATEADPQLSTELQPLGTETAVLAIAATSPAIGLAREGCRGTDQRDVPRPRGPGCDAACSRSRSAARTPSSGSAVRPSCARAAPPRAQAPNAGSTSTRRGGYGAAAPGASAREGGTAPRRSAARPGLSRTRAPERSRGFSEASWRCVTACVTARCCCGHTSATWPARSAAERSTAEAQVSRRPEREPRRERRPR